jgi:hypothetical protein
MQGPPSAPGNKGPPTTNVLIIYTGGTIGMQPGSDGSLQPCKGFLTDMIPKMDELTRPGMPRATGQCAQRCRRRSGSSTRFMLLTRSHREITSAGIR